MRVVAAGDAGIKSGQHEGLYLVPGCIDAHRFGRQFVFTDAYQGPTEPAGHQTMHADDRQQNQEKNEIVILDAGFDLVAENPGRGNVHDSQGAVGEAHPVLQYQEKNHVEAKRCQGHVDP